MSQTTTLTLKPSTTSIATGAPTNTADVPSNVTNTSINVPTAGVHNIAMGSNEYIHKRPTFTDKKQEQQWILEHTAASFRFFGDRGYHLGTAGHISVRDPINPKLFWINPLGKHFSLMKVSDLVQVDQTGKIVGGNTSAVINAAGFQIHSAIHEARPDVNAACHAHSKHGVAYSSFGKELDMINQDVCIFYKTHSVYNNFGGIVLDDKEGEEISKNLQDGKALILQNHGLLTVGETIDEAAFLFDLLERCCEVQLQVDSSNFKPKLVGDEEATYTYKMTSDPESLYAEFQPYYEILNEQTNGAFLK